MDSSRYYRHHFSETSESVNKLVTAAKNDIHDNFKGALTEGTKRLLQRLEDNKRQWSHDDDYSIYTGSAGVAYMFYHYGKTFNEPAYISKATELLRNCVSKYRSRHEITFLTGLAGPLAVGAIVLHSERNEKESQNLISKLKSLSANVLNERADVPDELLYGRAGYLFSLLYVNQNITPPPIDGELITQVIAQIIKSGAVYSKSNHCKSPLMYSWHDKEYIGGAHGLAGILYLLLQAKQYLTEAQLKNEVKSALLYLQKLKLPSGNFPSSLGNDSDRLVQWCHGAPGLAVLFCLAYEIFEERHFLDTAIECGELVWSKGLVKKGYGICHGVAGNAYTFLQLFQKTKDAKYLYRACKFAEWCIDPEDHQARTPDRPFSLFEGLAGVIYFLCDMQHPMLAKFPAYTL